MVLKKVLLEEEWQDSHKIGTNPQFGGYCAMAGVAQ